MIYEYSRNANKSKVTVSCETVKSRTPSMGSLDLSVESMTRVGEGPVRGRPPTMSKIQIYNYKFKKSIVTED